MSTVWIVHPIDKQDLSSAAQYGQFRFINHRFIYGDQISDDGHVNEHFLRKMHEAVEEFEPDDDFLLIAGDHLQIAQMCVFLGQTWGSFKVLRWDRRAEGYFQVWLEETLDGVDDAVISSAR